MAKGWRGDPPRDDAEARERIVDAAMRCIDRHGPKRATLSDVAAELGVTRPTIYRHFTSTEELFVAVGLEAADGYLDRLAAHVRRLRDPGEAFIEGIAYTLEQLPKERFLGLLLTTHPTDAAKRVTSPQAVAFGRSMLARTAVDWGSLGFDDADLDGLATFGLRMLQSLVLDPPPDDPRAFLRRWVAPAVAAGTRR